MPHFDGGAVKLMQRLEEGKDVDRALLVLYWQPGPSTMQLFHCKLRNLLQKLRSKSFIVHGIEIGATP